MMLFLQFACNLFLHVNFVVLGFVPKQMFYKHTWSQVTIILEPASFCLFLWVPVGAYVYFF